MHTVLVLSCFVTTLLGQAAAPEQPSNDELRKQVEQLVQQLNDRERPKREEAEKVLVAFGAPVLEFLIQPNNSMPAETRERLSRVRGALENIASAAVLQGSVVSLMGEMSLEDAMKSLAKQNGESNCWL